MATSQNAGSTGSTSMSTSERPPVDVGGRAAPPETVIRHANPSADRQTAKTVTKVSPTLLARCVSNPCRTRRTAKRGLPEHSSDKNESDGAVLAAAQISRTSRLAHLHGCKRVRCRWRPRPLPHAEPIPRHHWLPPLARSPSHASPSALLVSSCVAAAVASLSRCSCSSSSHSS